MPEEEKDERGGEHSRYSQIFMDRYIFFAFSEGNGKSRSSLSEGECEKILRGVKKKFPLFSPPIIGISYITEDENGRSLHLSIYCNSPLYKDRAEELGKIFSEYGKLDKKNVHFGEERAYKEICEIDFGKNLVLECGDIETIVRFVKDYFIKKYKEKYRDSGI